MYNVSKPTQFAQGKDIQVHVTLKVHIRGYDLTLNMMYVLIIGVTIMFPR